MWHFHAAAILALPDGILVVAVFVKRAAVAEIVGDFRAGRERHGLGGEFGDKPVRLDCP